MGTRLRPLTLTTPKCLVPINGKPLLQYWLDVLLASEIDRLLINTHYLSEAVRSFVGTSSWSRSIELVHEDKLLGTGGTILANRSFFLGQTFMVIHADNLSRFDLTAFLTRHRDRRHGVEMTMMTFTTDVPQSCGVVELDKHGIVFAFHEKVSNPPGNLANGAIYILEPTIIDHLASLNKSFIDFSTEVVPQFLGRIQTFHNTDYHRDIGTMESFAAAQSDFRPIPLENPSSE